MEPDVLLKPSGPSAIPEIVLIGDSIRMGYEPVVRAALAGRATVWGPETNGGHTVNAFFQR